MKYEPMTLLEFQERFRTEVDCQNALAQMRWPDGFLCPKCGHDVGYQLTEKRRIQCACCRHQTSLTAGTIFHKTRLPLRLWFWMIYMVAHDKGGASAMRLSKELRLRYATVWLMLHKIRAAMSKRDGNYKLSGALEIDQAFFGRAATTKKPSKADNQAMVLVMIESQGKKAGYLDMSIIDAASREAIEARVAQKVEPRQRARTDGLQANYVIRSMGHQLNAEPVSGFQACIEMPWVHTAIALAKRFLLGTYHGVSAKYLQFYLDEFCYRFNRRHCRGTIVTRLLQACTLATPVYEATLTG
jgi:transposase-like protein